ncbi:MAG: hypothetical protein KDE55_14480 [Novosphingobium sp.]|nr:hypothetical protein [Novosphingobium sp.]
MKKIAYAAFASAAALALAACGSSEPAGEEATAETVEMPADEAMGEADASAEPAEEATAAEGEATEAAPAEGEATEAAAE